MEHGGISGGMIHPVWDANGRHWDAKNERLAVDDEQPTPHRRRRPTRKWCKGKVGVQHTPEIRLESYVESLMRYPRIVSRGRLIPAPNQACRWVNHWRKDDWHYHCSHQRWCTTCGKILKTRLEPRECPDYSPKPPVVPAAKAG